MTYLALLVRREARARCRHPHEHARNVEEESYEGDEGKEEGEVAKATRERLRRAA